MVSSLEEYPKTICMECGTSYGHMPKGHLATFYQGMCGWCKRKRTVTEPRDYGYPPYPGALKGAKKS